MEANSRPLKFYRGKVDGDITKRDNSQAPSCDVYLAGFPCQQHSSEGASRTHAARCFTVLWIT